jgi:MFS family permease
VDLAPPALRGRHLSLIVWATTIGAVAGPNLTAAAGESVRRFGVPTLAGPFVFSALLFLLAATGLLVLLRPDPAIVARTLGATAGKALVRHGMLSAFRAVRSRPPAAVGVSAMAVGHIVMVAVMAMTPVHIREGGHDAAHTLRIVGVVLSLHIAGMYALSPVVGWLTDRLGRRPVIGLGVALLIAACAISGTAGHDSARLAAGLTVLGMGWSSTMVAGSTLLSESVPDEMRAAAQGFSDLVMGLAGASAGAVSGLVVGGWGYPILALASALATIPLVVFVVFARRSKGTTAAAAGV